MDIVLIGLLIGFCLTLAGFSALLRAAFTSFARDQLPEQMILKQDKIISALMTAYVFFVFSALILITHYLLGRLNNWQTMLHCLLLTVFIIPITDIFPRLYLLKQPYDFRVGLLKWINVMTVIFDYPARFLALIGYVLMRLFKPGVPLQGNLFNTMEYYPLVSRYYESAASAETTERKEYDLQKILTRFVGIPVTNIMTKIGDVKAMDASMPVDELITAVFESNTSRILLFQDRPENIVGILHTSLLMKSFCLAEGDKNMTDLTSAISEPYFISETTSIFEQMDRFSRQHQQFALIKDNQGNLQGAIAMDSILEKLFSELRQ